eukprot:3742135-Rhodomonas_salina.3
MVVVHEARARHARHQIRVVYLVQMYPRLSTARGVAHSNSQYWTHSVAHTEAQYWTRPQYWTHGVAHSASQYRTWRSKCVARYQRRPPSTGHGVAHHTRAGEADHAESVGHELIETVHEGLDARYRLGQYGLIETCTLSATSVPGTAELARRRIARRRIAGFTMLPTRGDPKLYITTCECTPKRAQYAYKTRVQHVPNASKTRCFAETFVSWPGIPRKPAISGRFRLMLGQFAPNKHDKYGKHALFLSIRTSRSYRAATSAAQIVASAW